MMADTMGSELYELTTLQIRDMQSYVSRLFFAGGERELQASMHLRHHQSIVSGPLNFGSLWSLSRESLRLPTEEQSRVVKIAGMGAMTHHQVHAGASKSKAPSICPAARKRSSSAKVPTWSQMPTQLRTSLLP